VTTTTERTKVLAPMGAESEWLCLADVARRLFATTPVAVAPDAPIDVDDVEAAAAKAAAAKAARARIVEVLADWHVKVRVLPYPDLREMEARHDFAREASDVAGKPHERAAAARELAEAELAVLKAGLARVRHGSDGDGYAVDEARADDIARWAYSWIALRAVTGYNALPEESRAGFFTQAPAP
jgi:hypothetical protein